MAARSEEFAGLLLEQPRPVDSSYQASVEEYNVAILRILERLAVRAESDVRARLLNLQPQITNRGQGDVFVREGRVIIDLARLDLMYHLATEYAISTLRRDVFYMMEFFVAYAIALQGDKRLEQIDPLNHSVLTDEQNRTLWDGVVRLRNHFFENELAFVIAHELGHLALGHPTELEQHFPIGDATTHHVDDFNRMRRSQELAADAFATDLALRALYAPISILPSFWMMDVRRRYLGRSADYPEPERRETGVRRIVQNWVDDGRMPEELGFRDEPPPIRTMVWLSNQRENLTAIRDVRRIRWRFQVLFDEAILEGVRDGATSAQQVNDPVQFIEIIRISIQEACPAPSALDDLANLVDRAAAGAKFDREGALRLTAAACGQDGRQAELLRSMIEMKPPMLGPLANVVRLMLVSKDMMPPIIEWNFLLANSVLRWHPAVFKEMLISVQRHSGEMLEIEPYTVGKPPVGGVPRHADVIEFLKNWDGDYNRLLPPRGTSR